MSAIVWLRRDLRLHDNAALNAAVLTGLPITVLYIHEADTSEWQHGAASRTWLHKSLTSLALSLEKIGATLLIRCGKSADVLAQLIVEVAATHVFWHHL